MQEIEGVEVELVAGAFGQRVLQKSEAADALGVEHDDLAIDNSLTAWQPGEGMRQVAVAPGPVKTGACDEPHLALSQMRHGAITVELDFVQPDFAGAVRGVIAARRLRNLRGQLRPDPGRRWRLDG